jgi:hypothetical protein
VLFHGSPRDLIARAQGHVWALITPGERPNGGVSVVSSLQLQEGTQYRVLGAPAVHHHARPLEPSLEDGYMWLMREKTAA